jgi:hypothetical protein
MLVPVAAKCKERIVLDSWNNENVSNLTRGMDVCPLFSILCFSV